MNAPYPHRAHNPHPRAYCAVCGALKPCVSWRVCSPLCDVASLLPREQWTLPDGDVTGETPQKI